MSARQQERLGVAYHGSKHRSYVMIQEIRDQISEVSLLAKTILDY